MIVFIISIVWIIGAILTIAFMRGAKEEYYDDEEF